MLFNSFSFVFAFLPISLAGFYSLGRLGRTTAAIWLIVMSLLFYACWNASFLLLLLGSIAFNYTVSETVILLNKSPRWQSACLMLGVAANIVALGYFKYLVALVQFAGTLKILELSAPSILLPLGISFFTFTQIGYLVDVKQGTAENRGFLNYVLFVTFFPHLIAGPILHNREIMPQFEAPSTYRYSGENFAAGLSLFIMGFAKKCLLADPLSETVAAGFQAAPHSPLFSAWNTALSYTLQLYFDFSGYSDMAIGIARMFNVHFPLNFNSPYKASSIIDFWQRWHMTLTRYLTLYLYSPVALAISRWRASHGLAIGRPAQSAPGGFAMMVAFPIFLTMILAGVWHGAGLQFFIFGLLHAVYLTINHAWRLLRRHRSIRRPPGRLTFLSSFLLTFVCALIARIFFRSPSVPAALDLMSGMIGLHGIDSVPMPEGMLRQLGRIGDALLTHGVLRATQPVDVAAIAAQIFWLALLYTVVFVMPNSQQIMARFWSGAPGRQPGQASWLVWQPNLTWGVALGMIAAVSILAVGGTTEFLYFQF